MKQEVNEPVAAKKWAFSWKRVAVNSLAGFGGLILVLSAGTTALEAVTEPMCVSQSLAAQANLAALQSALNEYALVNGEQYPEALSAVCEPDSNGNTFLGRRKLPLDPWKQEYYYWRTQGGRSFVLETRGKDGEPGGRGDNQDFRVTAAFEDGE